MINTRTHRERRTFKNQNSWARDTRTRTHSVSAFVRSRRGNFLFSRHCKFVLKSLVTFFGVIFVRVCVCYCFRPNTIYDLLVVTIRWIKAQCERARTHTETLADMRFIWSKCFIQMRHGWQMCCKEKGRFFVSFAILATHKTHNTKCFYHWLWNNQSSLFFFAYPLCVHSNSERVSVSFFCLFAIADIGVSHLAKIVPFSMKTMRKSREAKKCNIKISTCRKNISV